MLRVIGRAPAVAAISSVPFSAAARSLRIAEDVQLSQRVRVPRTAWSTLRTRRLRPPRIARADQIREVEAFPLLATARPSAAAPDTSARAPSTSATIARRVMARPAFEALAKQQAGQTATLGSTRSPKV